MSYEAAEQAYTEHRFAEARALVAEHLNREPEDLRGLLLQGYIAFFGFQDPEAAATSYQRVLELCSEGSYRDLAAEGLSNCPVALRAAPQQADQQPQSRPSISSEPAPATPWLVQFKPEAAPTALASQPAQWLQENRHLTSESQPEAEVEATGQDERSNQEIASPEAPPAEPEATYKAAEAAYQQRDFVGARALIHAVLAEHPNDLRALLLQGYVYFFGFQDETAAVESYQQVLALCPDGPYRQLAEEGLTQCGINIHEQEDETGELTPESEWLDPEADLAFQPQPAGESNPQSDSAAAKRPTETRPLSKGWFLVNLSSVG
jgi:tetratricopeptide (TPR) repeat protein